MLALLVTAKEFRRRGAASLLVRWGIELSEKNGLPCYVQASEQGQKLYEHHGFEDLETVEFDLVKYGMKGVERMTEMLRNSASRKTVDQAENEEQGFNSVTAYSGISEC